MLLLFIGFVSATCAQTDMIILKKRNKTVQRYYTGSFISLQLNNEQRTNGYIKKLKQDTIYLIPVQEKLIVNFLGMLVTDTVVLNTIKISLRSIHAVPKEEESFSYIKDGSLFQILSGGYIVLNLINAATSKEQLLGSNNAKRLGTAAGVFGIGSVMHVLHNHSYIIGKKYHLQIIQLTPSK